MAVKAGVNRVAETNGKHATVSTAKGKNAAQEFVIPPMDLRIIELTLVGDTTLISHAWSEKAIKQMADKQAKKAKEPRAERDPWRDFVDSMYWISPKPEKPTEADIKKAKFGIPGCAIKAATVAACRQVTGMAMTQAKGLFHVLGDLIEIKGPPPTLRRDMVRLETGVADIRYRGEFEGWRCTVKLQYNAGVISAEQLINLVNIAGFASGLLEHRPSSPKSLNGNHGMFHVQRSGE